MKPQIKPLVKYGIEIFEASYIWQGQLHKTTCFSWFHAKQWLRQQLLTAKQKEMV